MNKPSNKFILTQNRSAIPLQSIPVLHYPDFCNEMLRLLSNNENHCINYFGYPTSTGIRFIACIANDSLNKIAILSHILDNSYTRKLNSLTPYHYPLHIFEREIAENFGLNFPGHPWLKPVRYSHNRQNQANVINNYPFYTIKSKELHEVGVGPVHAGIIEPGHFRFTCNGENVLHLEIQLGWQHRGIESLMLEKKKILQKTIIAESIAGDTAIGHSYAFAQAMEALAGIEVNENLEIERSIALELERIAIHIGDISALCTDVAYNLGTNVFAVQRTGVINFMQSWCGNRLGKGMIRVGGTNYPFSYEKRRKLEDFLEDLEKRFIEMSHRAYKLPSLENRFDEIGTITEKQARLIGSVGMAARMANVNRDIRESHPFGGFIKYPYEAIVLPRGDVFSRFLLRRKELKRSIQWIMDTLGNENFDKPVPKPLSEVQLKPDTLSVSLIEGWRGEICHCAVTGSDGQLAYYKIKDPSMHNWKSLELSLRDLEISDFPINNKSYNLSYCGHDL